MKNNALVKRFLGTVSLQLFGKALSVIVGILIARVLGPEEFGRYSLVLSVIAVAVLPATAGLPQLLIREISRYRVKEEFGLITGMLRWTLLYILIMSASSMLVLIGMSEAGIWGREISVLIVYSLFLIPIRSMLIRNEAVINSLQKPELAQLPNLIFIPVFLLVGVSSLYFASVALDAQVLIYVNVISCFLALFFCYFLLKYVNRISGIRFGKRSYQIWGWQKALTPFSILAVVGALNNEVAILALGFFSNEEAIGFFKVAMQGVAVLILGLQAVNSVLGPRIATLYSSNSIVETQRLLKQSVYLSVMSSLPFALTMIIWGKEVLSYLFGEAYTSAAEILAILCLGQIINVCMGSVGLVLNMTGNEKRSLRAQLIAFLLTIILLFVLVPLFQATGAAIAVSIGLTCLNLIMAFDVYRLTRLKTWFHF